jgi:UDP-glucose 4-epimerase
VTGGAGYIGSILVDQLLDRQYSVFVLDDLATGHRAAVARGASFVQGNVGNRELVDALLARERIDAVVHMAAFALVAESVAQPQKYVTNNVTAARVLLEAVARAGVRRFVFSSSCAVYGHPARIPITEDTPQVPVNPYGETKRDSKGCWPTRAAARHRCREPAH